ncbi:hypothetical protein FE257_008349 [Aspergillus nanangensis]|uniref:PBP domain-containing protein n=1 Tax=Aspergillus nanangensis TaxID=2582783 RepID=A0AAD4CM46_ASPNN|nr:hypothetical protein FE257_008349 [Aspergillus nanangensis]
MRPFSIGYSSALALGLAFYTQLVVADIYDGGCGGKGEVKLRIGNGGAGQSGLVKELANHFIKNKTDNCAGQTFKVEWVKGDTTETINNIKVGAVDIGITYSQAAEKIAIQSGIAQGCRYCENQTMPCFGKCTGCTEKPCYTFRDHFLLTGPGSNTPRISKEDDIQTTFSKLYAAAENDTARFLTRYDKSATNIKDSELWISIGQVPWATAYSTWYHQYIDYPIQALSAASLLQEYTITDRGTYLTLADQNKTLTDNIHIYKNGEDVPELLNSADIIVATKPKDKEVAANFVKWVHGHEGQQVIVNFHKKDGYCLYKGFPNGKQDVVPTDCKWELGSK